MKSFINRSIKNNKKTIEEIKLFLIKKGFSPPDFPEWYKTLDFEQFKEAMK